MTIGQYMQPMKSKMDVDRYARLERYAEFEEYGNALGFRLTLSGPYVRSSFGAAEAARVLGVLDGESRPEDRPRMHGGDVP